MGCFRDHIVTAWIGNSVKVATKHCLRIDDRHFEETVRGRVCIRRSQGRDTVVGSDLRRE
jgi:hypothetical protein